ncbi:Virus attachment protein p12 family protein [Paraliobacillus sp. PM-2]|nr:Virus attachment protein p12 family protein [Paraliobacillus sp. PM-2]
MISWVIGIVIFGYAAWTLIQHARKSYKGKCAACELRKYCEEDCESPNNYNDKNLLGK